MLTAIALLLSILFLVLSIVHFYWTVGGKRGLSIALPSKEGSENVLPPRKTACFLKIACFLVGLFLLVFSIFYFLESGLLPLAEIKLAFYIRWGIPSIFFLRSIGDFKYVGFFRQVKRTPFAKKDAQIFTPLCLAITILGLMLALIK